MEGLNAAAKMYILRLVPGIGTKGSGGSGGRGLSPGVTRLRESVPLLARFAGMLTANWMRAVRLRREYSVVYIIVNGGREGRRLMQIQKAEGRILPENE